MSLHLLAPALVPAAFLAAFLVYCVRCAIGRAPEVGEVKHNQLLGRFFGRFLAWLLGPVELALAGRVSPNALTMTSLALCAATGVTVAIGELPAAVTLYTLAGVLDVLDGRLARRAGVPSASGALLDSVGDRWGELLVLTGYAWPLHDSPWLLAVLAAIGGSTMVSYTRARAEGLGVKLANTGVMQRAERIVLVAAGTLVAAIFDDAVWILGVTMLALGVLSSATAVGRWVVAYRELARRAASDAAQIVPLEPRLKKSARQ